MIPRTSLARFNPIVGAPVSRNIKAVIFGILMISLSSAAREGLMEGAFINEFTPYHQVLVREAKDLQDFYVSDYLGMWEDQDLNVLRRWWAVRL